MEDRGKMDGHCEHYSRMHVLAARLGKLGKTAEEELIRFALTRSSDKCTNKSRKSLGIKAEPTHVIFILRGVLMSNGRRRVRPMLAQA